MAGFGAVGNILSCMPGDLKGKIGCVGIEGASWCEMSGERGVDMLLNLEPLLPDRFRCTVGIGVGTSAT